MSKAQKKAEVTINSSKTRVKTKTKTKLDTKKENLTEKDEISLGASRYNKLVPKIQKRNGTIALFDFDRIKLAIFEAMKANNEGSETEADMVAHKVMADVVRISKKYKTFMPTVEGIQDTVEKELMLGDYVATAKGYILYREERSKKREELNIIPEKVKKLAQESKKYFKDNPLGEFVYLRTYSRWIENENRRETWIETVDRYVDFMKENLGNKLSEKEYTEVRDGILNHEAMPSMRLLQFSGEAARRCNVCAYNCSFIAPSKIRDFAEIMYISMCGTGVGWSVESRNIEKLPQIKFQTGKKLSTHIIEDSKEGWSDALIIAMETWMGGKDIDFDYSKLRPAGARLKTMGGKSSGPEPLKALINFLKTNILNRQGRRLRTIDAHDIICKIGEIVVAGGVRRSAMISLSDLDDESIRHAKDGQFYLTDPHRMLANNSAVYEEKPTNEEFMEEWMALMKGKTGERGIFNRGGLINHLPKRRIKVFEKRGFISNNRVVGPIGTNPCGEILLQSKQFCNLTEVVARPNDTEKDLLRKIRIATILGTYQATLSKFGYLSKEWKDNCDEERLLGVSITGQRDCKEILKKEVISNLRDESIKINKEYSKRFGIGQSTCITTTKPSGNLSQTVNCSSGLHPRFSPFYIRRVRIASTDSLFKMLKEPGVPYKPEVGQTMENATTYVMEFPVKSPKSSVFNNDLSALDQLEYWRHIKENYTEHNPSATIYIGENEWVSVANWLYENWDIVGGLSFLPRNDHVYNLAPYEEIKEDEYNEMIKKFKDVDYSKLVVYELKDETEMKKELACAGGLCEIE